MKARTLVATVVVGAAAALLAAPAATAGESACASVRAVASPDDWNYRASAVMRAVPETCVESDDAGRVVAEAMAALRWYR